MSPEVVLHDALGRRWLRFDHPLEIIETTEVKEVAEALAQVEAAVSSAGLYAAGFLGYEAAPAFDPALQVRPAGRLPLLWFGLYREPSVVPAPAAPATTGGQAPALESAPYVIGHWQPSVDWSAYAQAIERIKAYIAAGQTYQVNYTLRLRAAFEGRAWDFFADLIRAQQADFGAYLDLGQTAICSASPELFIRRQGPHLVSRPMKGTAARGRTLAEDEAQANWLANSDKNRAENVMIVDMIRNDLGRVARLGSVQVPGLFELERYPTVWQMCSTVEALSDAPLTQVLAALFPCASITGAPKVRTTAIIAELEKDPRGVYTGAIGYLAPGGLAQFNVAIRTAVIDRQRGQVEYGVGGGIVWDSLPEEEYAECQTKARVLSERRPAFELLESLLWTPEAGYFLLDEHLERLAESAAYFGFPAASSLVRQQLEAFGRSLTAGPHKVRLLLDPEGALRLEASQIDITKLGFAQPEQGQPGLPLRLGLALEPVDERDVFLYHKTTHRAVYEAAQASRPDCDEVLLWNRRGEITETATANVVVELDGELLTPALDCGLLRGTFRRHLLAQGQIREAVITCEELRRCQAIYLINGVRRWRPAKLVDGT